MLSSDTKNIQKKLADYTRTGKLSEIPGIHTGHVKHYRRLVFNIIKNNIFQAFPIATEVIGKRKFTQMIDEFFSIHDVQTSQVWLLPGEFCEFANTYKWNEKYAMPWLSDLLLFEWIEIMIHTKPDGSIPKIKLSGNIMLSQLVINPDYKIIKLSYPVHMMPVKEAGNKKGNYYLLIFRNPDSGKVHFINLSILHASLIENMSEDRESLNQILPKLATEFRIQDYIQLQTAMKSFVKELMDQKFILGFLSD